ncbi:probable mediator of RNA polymerase II transcription subunit 15b isoform X2 [Lotus japonicus]|uniref:probable mediator of RNA polymerase II transcription subunit 15b isoform X2 n=1 Tax=Lotus japonicus TaxID=34305 RepID=UPI002583583A|nr:probable mediator of RNA polymerase II transcription subunit 15b isoform X2 [Lotus japonicus]
MQPQVHNQGQQHPIPPANQLQSRQMQGNQHVVSKQQQQPQQNLLQSNQLQSSAMQQHNQQSNNVQQSTQSMHQQHPQVIRHKQQPNTLQRDMWRRLQASGSLTLPQSVLDQQKQLCQSQRPLPKISSTSLDSTTQTGQPNGGDWQEEVYQKIKTMKENYLPDLNELYQKIGTKLQQHDSLAQQSKSDKLEKYKLFKMMLERMISFLQVSKSNIAPSFKEKLGSYEKQIINFININRPRKGMSSLQNPGHLPPQHMHSMSQSHPQVTQVQPLENQINSQMQTTNMQGSVAPVVVLVSSISHGANIGHQQTGCAAVAAQSLAIGTSGISAPPESAEFTGPDGVHGNSFPPTLGKSTVSEQPLDRLIKAVKSLTPNALSTAVSDIGSVVSMNDRIVGSAPGNGTKAAAGEDLVAMTNCRLQARNFINQDGANGTRRMKRCTHATPLNDVSYAVCLNNSIKQLEASDLDSTATCIKKPRIQGVDQ